MRKDCVFSFEEMRLAVNAAERVKQGEERVFTLEQSIADLEGDHRPDAASYNVGPLMPVFDPERSERIARMQKARQRAEIKLESGTVEAMTVREVQKEIDAWRSERSESAMASILRGPLAAEVKAAMSSPSTPSRVYYKESP